MLKSILTSPASAQPTVAHESIEVLDGLGLEYDRYALGRGFYTGAEEWDAQVTLIAKEPFDELAAKHGIVIEPSELRRNLVTEGVDVNALIGKQFRIGAEVVLRGIKPWPPCSHIVKLTGKKEIMKYLAKQSGIGAEVVTGGTIRVGDSIVVEPEGKDDA